MKITHYGHACVVVENTEGGSERILIDPGSLCGDLGAVGHVDACLVTHGHPDHIAPDKFAQVLRGNPDLGLFVDSETSTGLPEQIRDASEPIDASRQPEFAIGGLTVSTMVTEHAPIHPSFPPMTNNAYLVGGSVFHPGDSFLVPDVAVDVLLLPIGAPWLKLSEAVDYLRAVAPRVAIPIHQGGLAPAHRALHGDVLGRLAPEGTALHVLEEGRAEEL